MPASSRAEKNSSSVSSPSYVICAGWSFGGFSIDASYTHIFIKDASINLPDRTGASGPPGLTANYENSVDILSVQGVWRF